MEEDSDKPGFHCQWVPNDEGTTLGWSGREKFYDYIGWLEYLIEHFFELWGCELNGKVIWRGGRNEDMGVIHVRNNVIRPMRGEITSPEPNWEE